jgi:hypothetical protein
MGHGAWGMGMRLSIGQKGIGQKGIGHWAKAVSLPHFWGHAPGAMRHAINVLTNMTAAIITNLSCSLQV